MAALAAVMAGAGGARGATILQNGAFDSGAGGWTLIGGASVVATAEPPDNPYGRIPDGGLVFLYQTAMSAAPGFDVSFDYFTGLMSPAFPSPGAFPDTAFASIHFGALESELRPELFQSGGSVILFDFDAANGLRELLHGATLTASPLRSGWTRFSGTIEGLPGQPWVSITFQNLNGNGTAADSAFLVDNVEVAPIPEQGAAALTLMAVFAATVRRRRRDANRSATLPEASRAGRAQCALRLRSRETTSSTRLR